MKKHLLFILFALCTFVAFGQYKEYLKSSLEGSAYTDIRLVGFKDNEHAKKVMDAVSAKGHLRKHSYYITNLGDFVVQPEKKVGLLFKDEYVLFYRPQYRETEVVLEFYKLAYKPWNHEVTQGRTEAKPNLNLKQALSLVDEVKKFAALYAANDNELQSVQNEWNQKLEVYRQEAAEEERAKAKNKDRQSAITGFRNEGQTGNGGDLTNKVASGWLPISSKFPEWDWTNPDERYTAILAVAYGLGYHPDPATNKCKSIFYNSNHLTETDFPLQGSPFDISRTYINVEGGNGTFEQTLKDKPISENDLKKDKHISSILFFSYNAKVYAYELSFLKAQYYLSYLYEWNNGRLKFLSLSGSNKKDKPIREAFEKDVAARIGKMNSFLEDAEIRDPYYNEFYKRYGKQWDENWANYTKRIQGESKTILQANGYSLNAWVKEKKYSPLEGIWYFHRVSSSDCIKTNYSEIRKFYDNPNGKYALAFFVNAKGELEMQESRTLKEEHLLLNPVSLNDFQKIEGTVKQQGSKYIVYLKKYDYTFTVSLSENDLESALADYYANRKSLKELQRFVLNKERPESGYTIYWRSPEAYFNGSKCGEGINLTFTKVTCAILNQIVAVDPANEKAGQKFNFSRNFPKAIAPKKETIVKTVTPAQKRTNKENAPKGGSSSQNVKTSANPPAPANGKTPADYYNNAIAAINNNDPNKALRELQESVQTYPNDARLYGALGLLYLNMPNRQKAYECFKKVEQLEPSMLKKLYKKEILLGPIYARGGEEFNNVLIVSPTYGIVAGKERIKVVNCDFLCKTGIQFGGLGISISDSYFDTLDLCVEYTQTDVQIGNVFINNKFYGQWSNAE